MKAAIEFSGQDLGLNQLWQTDFTYLKIIGWGWCYLSTVLDDFSRYIVASKLCTTMYAKDVTATLELRSPPRAAITSPSRAGHGFFDDNGSILRRAAILPTGSMTGAWPRARSTLSSPTQGKIERWHQTLKNRILLENYYLPGDLEGQIERFVEHYNHHTVSREPRQISPRPTSTSAGPAILAQRARIKRTTIAHRRLQHHQLAA